MYIYEGNFIQRKQFYKQGFKTLKEAAQHLNFVWVAKLGLDPPNPDLECQEKIFKERKESKSYKYLNENKQNSGIKMKIEKEDDSSSDDIISDSDSDIEISKKSLY
jgi:hypothetical protein